MTSLTHIRRHPIFDFRIAALWLCGILAVASVGLLSAQQPLAALVVIAAVPAIVVLLAWPHVATLAVLFIIYSNAAVIGVRFHGVPYFVGAAVSLILLVPLAYYLVIRQEKVIITPVVKWIGLFVLIQLLATLYSADTSHSMSVLAVSIIEGLGLYVLVTNVIRTPAMLRLAIWVMLAAGTLLGSVALVQQTTGAYHNDFGGFAQMSNTDFRTGIAGAHGEVRQRRLAGPLGNQNYHAQIMLMLIPLAVFRFWGERGMAWRAAAALATVLIALGITLTFSRGAAVGFVLMLLVMGALGYIKLRHCALFGVVALVALMLFPQYATRLASLGALGDAAAGNRAGVARADGAIHSRYNESMAAVMMAVDHPLVGVGPGMYPEHYPAYAQLVGGKGTVAPREAHTLYFGLAAELGIGGLIVFLVIVGVTLRDLARARRINGERRPELANMATALMLAVVVFLTSALFLHFAFVRYFWLVMALAGVAGHLGAARASRAATAPVKADPRRGEAHALA